MNHTKNVIITGGLGGIGFDISKYFINKKFNLIIIDNQPKKNFDRKILNCSLSKNNQLILYYKIDLTNIVQIKNLFKKLQKKFNSLDILINCAGIQHISPIINYSDKIWEKIISINLSSYFFMIKYILPIMKKNNWGRIVNIASTHGHVASVNKSGYVASKHGVIGLTKSVALETAELPITCNAVCPGWVNTPLVSKQIKQRAKKNKTSVKIEEINLLKEKQPNLSFIDSNNIASLVYFLSSNEAQDITGSSINIDGGWTSQ